MIAAPVACAAGCGQRSVEGSRYCAAHTTAPPKRPKDAVDKMYNTAHWRHFRAWIMKRNVQCQRIWFGDRCRGTSTIAHHLISPRMKPELMFVGRNIVCVCEHCHPDTIGSPTWKVDVNYVATVV